MDGAREQLVDVKDEFSLHLSGFLKKLICFLWTQLKFNWGFNALVVKWGKKVIDYKKHKTPEGGSYWPATNKRVGKNQEFVAGLHQIFPYIDLD